MKKIILLTLSIILIPLFIIGLTNKNSILTKIKYGFYINNTIKVKITKTNEIVSIPIEDYVIGVVAGEVPASFDLEALKAQAVASRTYALEHKQRSKTNYDVTDNTQNQVYINLEDMKNKWKNNYDSNLNKIINAVNLTKGEVILYDNNLIDAMFFSTSNGYTENSENVFSSKKPYLISVPSPWDKQESPVFKTTSTISKKEFLFNLGLSDNDKINITDIKTTNTKRVISLNINGKNFKGSEIKAIFKLRSTSFTIEIKEDKVNFIVNGFGHGVGMSQYGANGMAKEGYSYKDILKHYYKNCEIKKIN